MKCILNLKFYIATEITKGYLRVTLSFASMLPSISPSLSAPRSAVAFSFCRSCGNMAQEFVVTHAIARQLINHVVIHKTYYEFSK